MIRIVNKHHNNTWKVICNNAIKAVFLMKAGINPDYLFINTLIWILMLIILLEIVLFCNLHWLMTLCNMILYFSHIKAWKLLCCLFQS